MSELKILLVDDDKVDLKAHTRYLAKSKDYTFYIDEADNIDSAIYKLGGKNYDCVLLDYNMPGYSGLELLDKIREIDPNHNIPIIFLTGQGDEKTAVNAFRKGVCDYLIKDDINSDRLVDTVLKVINARKEQQKKLEEDEHTKILAYIDPLTKLLNRRGFERYADKIISLSKRHDINMALLYIDIDNFKDINDTYGHHVGDSFLIDIANSISKTIRNEDLIARFGGDEFVLLISKFDNEKDLFTIANKIISSLCNITENNQLQIKATCSIGISIYDHDISLSENIRKADNKLYLAKNAGKNQFVF